MSATLAPLQGHALAWLSNAYVVGVHVTLFVAGVALAAAAARRASPAMRATLWSAAAVGPLVVTVLCYLPIGWWAPALVGAAGRPVVETGALFVGAQSGAMQPLARLVAALYVVWLVGVCILLARVARSWWWMTRVTSAAEPVRDREWDRLLRAAANALDVPVAVELRRSAAVASPVVWGVLDPVLLLPADADRWPDDQRRAVLLHELAHVRRGDCAVQLLAQVACAWYWPHPLLWWAAANLRRAREEACDRLVVEAGVRASDYASYLLILAGPTLRGPGAHSASMGLMARRPHLHLRIRRLLAGGAARTAPARSAPLRAAVWLVGVWMLLLGSVRLSVPRETLWRALGSDRGEVRAYAARVLSHSKDIRVRDVARARALADPDPLVRRMAAVGR